MLMDVEGQRFQRRAPLVDETLHLGEPQRSRRGWRLSLEARGRLTMVDGTHAALPCRRGRTSIGIGPLSGYDTFGATAPKMACSARQNAVLFVRCHHDRKGVALVNTRSFHREGRASQRRTLR